MQIRRLQSEDLSIVVAFLEEHLESSLFLLSNVLKGGLEYRGRNYEADYLGVFRDGTLIGLASHTWVGTLLIQAPCLEALNQLESALPRFLSRRLSGLLGPRDQCLELMERLSLDRGAATLDQDEPMYALELSRLRMPTLLEDPRVALRRSQPPDLKPRALWRADYLVEVMNFPSSTTLEQRAYTEVLSAHEERRSFVLEHDGERVAYGVFNAITPRAVQLGGLWVPPEHRGRGYGRSLMAAGLKEARDVERIRQGVVMIDDGNRPALNGSEALGFLRVGRYSFTLWEEG